MRSPRSRYTCLVQRGVLLLHLDERKQELHAQTLGAIVPKVRLTRDPRRSWRCGGRPDHPGAPRDSERSACGACHAMVHCLIASRVAAIYVWLGTRGSLGIQVIHEEGVAVRAAASILTSAVRIDGHLYTRCYE